MTAPRPLPAVPPAPGRRRRAWRTGVMLAAGALALTGCGLFSPDDAGAGTTTPPPASPTWSAPVSGQPSSSAAPADGYPGHERVERALRAELGEDAQISSHDGDGTDRLMASRGVDVLGPLSAGITEPCRSARQDLQRRTVDGMVGATFGQTADPETGELHMVNVVVMRDEATWRAVDADHHRVREECVEADGRERVTLPVEAGQATVTQSLLRGYPTAASDQVMRTAYVPGGRVSVNEMTRERLDGQSPVPLEEFAAERVRQLEAFIAEATG